jgi:hypothetical protein
MRETLNIQPKTNQLIKETVTQRVEVGSADEEFWIMFNDVTKDVLFGTVEMTIIAGTIDTIKVNRNYKILQKVDKDGRKIVELK